MAYFYDFFHTKTMNNSNNNNKKIYHAISCNLTHLRNYKSHQIHATETKDNDRLR